ncbi:MAG: CPBP family intramembrane metalloprotease [Myxococcota bacterium]|nr:CPBP family intramembrane metalloprotease [Myxococcota bacterium]
MESASPILVPPPRPQRLVRLSLWFYGGMTALALAWRAGVRGQSLVFGEGETQIDWLRDPLAGAIAAAAVILSSNAFTRHTRIGRELARALAALIGRLSWRACVVLAAASAIGEEALFRGALQPEIGWIAASVVFALAHLVPRRDLLPWSVFSLAAGLLLGFLYDATGNLVAPVVAHFGINAINLRRLSAFGVSGER